MALLPSCWVFMMTSILLVVDSYDMSNEVIGPPSVQCTQDIIKFTIRTRNPFRGNIYIKGNYDNDHCRQEFSANDFPEATLSVRIGECGMMRLRKLQPRGMAYHTVFVANFYSMFTTKLDKEYAVECFYELGHLSVQTDMEVSPIPMEIIKKATIVMPDCVYSVREGNVNGPRARNSIIGSQVVHRWDCNNDSKYGILVKNCHVHERSGLSIQIIDERGCPLRLPYLVNPIVYDVSSNMAYMMSEAVSIPDRNHVFFQCQIQICNRMENECLGLTPPNCPQISRNEFLPNSIIDSLTQPTKVVATFEGRIRSTIGNAIVEGTVGPHGTIDNKIPFTHSNYPREYAKFPWRKEQNHVDEEESLDEGHAENTDNSEDQNETETKATMQYNNSMGLDIRGFRHSALRTPRTGSSLRNISTKEPQRPSISIEQWMTTTSTKQEQPVQIFIKSTSPPPFIRMASDLREKRLADQVIDVYTDELTVRSASDDLELGVNSPTISTRVADLTCFNRTIILAIGGAFAFTTLLSMLLIMFLWKNLYKGFKEKKADSIKQFSEQSVGSDYSTDGSIDRPIYTRRLGDSNYVLPITHG